MSAAMNALKSGSTPEGVSTYESNDAITATRTKLHGAAKDFCLYLHNQTFGFGVMKRRQGVPVHSCRFELAPWARELRMDKANVRRVMARLIECDIIRFTPDPEQQGAGTISWNLAFDSWGQYDRRGQKPAAIVISGEDQTDVVISGEKLDEITTIDCSEITTAASSDAGNSQGRREGQEKILTGDTRDKQATARAHVSESDSTPETSPETSPAAARVTVLSVPSFLDRLTPGQRDEQMAVLDALRQIPGYSPDDALDARLLYQLHSKQYPPDWLLHEVMRWALSDQTARPTRTRFFDWCENGERRGFLRRFQDQRRIPVQSNQTTDPERTAGGYENERSQTPAQPTPISVARTNRPRHRYAQSSDNDLRAFYARQGLR